jgi:DNA-binding transcriptional LysR family regulator
VAKPLAPWRWILCAAPSYLARHGTPQRPQDLAAHNCIVYSSNVDGVWRFSGADGEESVRVRGNYKANNADGVLQGTLQGLGIAAITTMAAGDQVRSGRLIRLLPEWQLPHSVLYAAHLPNPTMQLCVRSFIQFLQDELGETPYWDEGLGFSA